VAPENDEAQHVRKSSSIPSMREDDPRGRTDDRPGVLPSDIIALRESEASEEKSMNERLELGPDVEAVLLIEEAAALQELHDRERVRCLSCGGWIDPGDEATVTVSLDAEVAVAELAHPWCAPARANLAELVAVALADPKGIAYVQALHPQAGAVLIWERKLDVRVRGGAHGEARPYVDARRASGFHRMRRDEPVEALPELRLERDGDDLVLRRGRDQVDRFPDGGADPPAGWFDALRASGYCLLIVGSELGLDHPGGERIQRALRSGGAIMGLVEFDAG
jgi:hypothetical protein